MSTADEEEWPPDWWPEGWEPMTTPDFFLLGFTLVHQLMVLCVVAHLVLKRDWPPYVTKNVTLVAATGVGSSFTILGGLTAYGALRRESGDFLAQCNAETLLTSLGVALHFFPAFIRVYRNYKLLIWHSASMWSAMVQLQFVSAPYLLPAITYLLKPSLTEFEEYRNRCFANTWINLASFFYMAAAISCAIVLVVRMKRVRKQLNESTMMTVSLAFLLIWALYLNPAGQWTWDDRPNIARRLVMVDNFVSTVVLFWCPICVPLLKYLQQDYHYVSQFTFGFSMLPTPAQMRASLADQLGVEDLRTKFRKYAAGRVAPELPDFYKACLDREQVEGYFERQAATMAIVDRFVAEGAEQEINISQECRKRVLDSDVTRYNIFDEAIAEVLNIMEVNFKADFERSESYKNLNRAVQREAKELELLKQANLVAQRPSREDSSRGCSKTWWPHPPGFDDPYTRQVDNQGTVTASVAADGTGGDQDEETGGVIGAEAVRGEGASPRPGDGVGYRGDVRHDSGGGEMAFPDAGGDRLRDTEAQHGGENKQEPPPGEETVARTPLEVPVDGAQRIQNEASPPSHRAEVRDRDVAGAGEEKKQGLAPGPQRVPRHRSGSSGDHSAVGGWAQAQAGARATGAAVIVHTSHLRDLSSSSHTASPEVLLSPFVAPSPGAGRPTEAAASEVVRYGSGRGDTKVAAAAAAVAAAAGSAGEKIRASTLRMMNSSSFFSSTPSRGRHDPSDAAASGGARDANTAKKKTAETPQRERSQLQGQPHEQTYEGDGGEDTDALQEKTGDTMAAAAGMDIERQGAGEGLLIAAGTMIRRSSSGMSANGGGDKSLMDPAAGGAVGSLGGVTGGNTELGAGEVEPGGSASSASKAKQKRGPCPPQPSSPARGGSFFGGRPVWKWKRSGRVGGVESFSGSVDHSSTSSAVADGAAAAAAAAAATAAPAALPTAAPAAADPVADPFTGAAGAVLSAAFKSDATKHDSPAVIGPSASSPPTAAPSTTVGGGGTDRSTGTPAPKAERHSTSALPMPPLPKRPANSPARFHDHNSKMHGVAAGDYSGGRGSTDDMNGGGGEGASKAARPRAAVSAETALAAAAAALEVQRDGSHARGRRRVALAPLAEDGGDRPDLDGAHDEAGNGKRTPPPPSPPPPALAELVLTMPSLNSSFKTTTASSIRSESSEYYARLRAFAALVGGEGGSSRTLNGSQLSSIISSASGRSGEAMPRARYEAPQVSHAAPPTPRRVGRSSTTDRTSLPGEVPADEGTVSALSPFRTDARRQGQSRSCSRSRSRSNGRNGPNRSVGRSRERNSRGQGLSPKASHGRHASMPQMPFHMPSSSQGTPAADSSPGVPPRPLASSTDAAPEKDGVSPAATASDDAAARDGRGRGSIDAADNAGGGGVPHVLAEQRQQRKEQLKQERTEPADPQRGGDGSTSSPAAAAAAAARAATAIAVAAASEVDPIVSPTIPVGNPPSPVAVVVSTRKHGVAGGARPTSPRWSDHSTSSSVSSLSVIPPTTRRSARGISFATAPAASVDDFRGRVRSGGKFARLESISSLSEVPGGPVDAALGTVPRRPGVHSNTTTINNNAPPRGVIGRQPPPAPTAAIQNEASSVASVSSAATASAAGASDQNAASGGSAFSCSSAEPEPSEITAAYCPDAAPSPPVGGGQETGAAAAAGDGQGGSSGTPPTRPPSASVRHIQRSPHLSAVKYTKTAVATAAAARSISPSSRRRQGGGFGVGGRPGDRFFGSGFGQTFSEGGPVGPRSSVSHFHGAPGDGQEEPGRGTGSANKHRRAFFSVPSMHTAIGIQRPESSPGDDEPAEASPVGSSDSGSSSVALSPSAPPAAFASDRPPAPALPSMPLGSSTKAVLGASSPAEKSDEKGCRFNKEAGVSPEAARAQEGGEKAREEAAGGAPRARPSGVSRTPGAPAGGNEEDGATGLAVGAAAEERTGPEHRGGKGGPSVRPPSSIAAVLAASWPQEGGPPESAGEGVVIGEKKVAALLAMATLMEEEAGRAQVGKAGLSSSVLDASRQLSAPLENRGEGSAFGSGDRNINVSASMAAGDRPSRSARAAYFAAKSSSPPSHPQEQQQHDQDWWRHQLEEKQRQQESFLASLAHGDGNSSIFSAESGWNPHHHPRRSASTPLEHGGGGSPFDGTESESPTAAAHRRRASLDRERGGGGAGFTTASVSSSNPSGIGELGSSFNNSLFNNSTTAASSILSGSSEYYARLRAFAALVGGGSDFQGNGSNLSSIPVGSAARQQCSPQPSPRFPPLPTLGPSDAYAHSSSPVSGSSEYYARRRENTDKALFPRGTDSSSPSMSPLSSTPSRRRRLPEDAAVANGAGRSSSSSALSSSSSPSPSSPRPSPAQKAELTAESIALAGMTATLTQPTALETNILSFLGGRTRAATTDGAATERGGFGGRRRGGRGAGFFRGESLSDDGILPARSFGDRERRRAGGGSGRTGRGWERRGAGSGDFDPDGGAPLSPVFTPLVREVRSVDRGRMVGGGTRQRRERRR